MESVPLLPKNKVLPNLDALPLIRELFQDEIELSYSQNLSKKLSQNILTSLQYEHVREDTECLRSPDFVQNFCQKKDLLKFSEKVFQAFLEHEKELENVRNAERNIFEATTTYLEREQEISQNKQFQDLLILKRKPKLEPLNFSYVKKYKLLEGESGLPPYYQLNSDFRLRDFARWKKKLESSSQDSLIKKFLKIAPHPLPDMNLEKNFPVTKENIGPTKIRKLRPKRDKLLNKKVEIFVAEPKMVFFTGYKPGEVYVAGFTPNDISVIAAEIEVKNVYTKGMEFQVKPMALGSPFSVSLKRKTNAKKLFPGLSFWIYVEFSAKSLDVVAEDIYIVIEDNKKLTIPLVAYLEPPILKTHKDIDEFTKITAEKIVSSCIECGACFTGDTTVIKLRFRCYRGSGEFFIMSSENWNRNCVNSVTSENMLEIPPFCIYPVYFKMNKDEVIDLFVEFSPKNSGMHVENIMITCDNGEVRSLDLLGDAVGWHRYFFSFQDDVLKELPVDGDDDIKVKHFLDFGETIPFGKVEKTFCISNNSNMAFGFQWKVREPNILSRHEDYMKLLKHQIKINPDNGTIGPNSICQFLVTIAFDKAEIGKYRTVLSLPYQCIEEDDTIIQPTGLVRNVYCQSLYCEDEFAASSSELLSLQGTYESLQESIRSYVECQSKAQANAKPDFCKTTCMPNPGLCAKPLKKSKTYFNLGDNFEEEIPGCACRMKALEATSISESCISNVKDEKSQEMPALKNEIIWDFVDILVDEIELWAEVSSLKLSLEPHVLDFSDSVGANEPPLIKELRIINHSRSSVQCEWVKPLGISLDTYSVDVAQDQVCLTLIFDPIKVKKDSERLEEGKEPQRAETNTDFEKNHSTKDWTTSKCEFKEELSGNFKVCELSEVTTSIRVSSKSPGKFYETLCLSVNNGDLLLTAVIQGTAVAKYFNVSSYLLDFGVIKQGTRSSKKYKINNEYADPILLEFNEFVFDFDEEKFKVAELPYDHVADDSWIESQKILNKTYNLDARVSGFKCSLLEIGSKKPDFESLSNQYVLVLGDVKIPSLSMTAPRFENAILAPRGTMYLNQKIFTNITLKNKGNLNTFFTWGYPFGCHSRKIKVIISPNKGEIQKRHKLILKVEITPLDQGIISHCYVPCFFCRSSEPLILSIVGVIDNLNVTFEIINSPKGSPTTEVDPLKPSLCDTILRIPWPMKCYDPVLGLKYIKEADVLNMICQCAEVEEETLQAYGSDSSNRNFSERGDESCNKSKQYIDKSIIKCSARNLDNVEETLKESVSGFCEKKKKNSEVNSVQKYASREPSLEAFHLMKAELEFFNLTYQTPATRQFVIRNETPVNTKFRIRVEHFGCIDELGENRIQTIRNQVYARPKDHLKYKKTKNQPLLITVDPAEGELSGYDAICINVVACGNTWGEYRDYILCHIQGISPFYLKVFVQILGHPFYFPMFETNKESKPVLRFQPVSYLSEPVSKRIRVINRSAIPITIGWLVFFSQPLLKEDDHEDVYDLCIDSNANLDSTHSEESGKSVKVYLPKNISDSASTFRHMLEMREFSRNSAASDSFRKGETLSEKNESQDFGEMDKSSQDPMTLSTNDEVKSGSQHNQFHIDLHYFQVDPKEISFEPFEEKKITVTFDPRPCKRKAAFQEFNAVLTGWIKLKPSDEKYPGVYYRPCGINFITEILDMSAIIEAPVVSCEIFKGDLKFRVDANDVLRSPEKQVAISRLYFIKNNSQTPVQLKIEISPGTIFRIKKLETVDRIYQNYDPEENQFNIQPAQLLQVQIECLVKYKDIIYAYEKLKLNKSKALKKTSSCEMKMTDTSKSIEEGAKEGDSTRKLEREPWCQYFKGLTRKQNTRRSSLEPKDSYKINLDRMASKSDNSICYDFPTEYYGETEGEFFELASEVEDFPTTSKSLRNVAIIQEKINFVQPALTTQTLIAELHLSFPLIRISSKTMNFGNVYIGDTGIRYCTLINLKGTPTEFLIKSKCNKSEFTVRPTTGTLPPTNYNSDIGETIAVEFTPSDPGYFTEVYQIYCNLNMEFDYYEVTVCGMGTWNEKYRGLKLETVTKLQGIYSSL